MTKQKIQKIIVNDLFNIKSKLCTNPEIADMFANDVLRITGLEYDNEGYVVDAEENPLEPDYIVIKDKFLRYTIGGILHSQDIIFDPYNIPSIMEELFRRYIGQCHPNIVSTQILAQQISKIPKMDTYGYITILYGNGNKIQTKCHYKDSTKYLEAFMRLESMTDNMIEQTISKYDKYEAEEVARIEKEKVK